MTVITIDEPFIVHQLNVLPPHSRKRAGYCDMLRHIRRRQLEQEALAEMLANHLEEEFRDYTVTQIEAENPEQAQRIRESF